MSPGIHSSDCPPLLVSCSPGHGDEVSNALIVVEVRDGLSVSSQSSRSWAEALSLFPEVFLNVSACTGSRSPKPWLWMGGRDPGSVVRVNGTRRHALPDWALKSREFMVVLPRSGAFSPIFQRRDRGPGK